MARGWDRPKTPSWVYAVVGVLLTLVVVLGIIVVMLLGGTDAGLASATSKPTATAGTAGTATGPGSTNARLASSAPTEAVTQGATEPPAATPAPTLEATPTIGPDRSSSPVPSIKPTVASISLPHAADCNKAYPGSPSGAGWIQISWATSGATGVRVSVDPPSPATAYGAFYAEGPPTGSMWVPFTCGPASHLYVVTTIHTSGYYQYRYAKVFQSPPPSALPSATP